MVESVIITLIWLCVVVAVFALVLWVLEYLGVPLPPKVIRIMWLIVGLLCLLVLWKLLLWPLIVSGHLASVCR